jgi:asparagine synthase (glutamine-hydrolysing)
MYIDVCTWMVDDVLVKVDRMSMAHGLEVRAPFLDHHVMELAAAIPCEWKVKGVQKKHLLKESQRARLPADVLARPKRGFNAPMAHWLQGDLRDFAGDHLESPKLDTWFVRDEIRKLWDEQLCGRRDNSFKLFGVLCFALWLEIN